MLIENSYANSVFVRTYYRIIVQDIEMLQLPGWTNRSLQALRGATTDLIDLFGFAFLLIIKHNDVCRGGRLAHSLWPENRAVSFPKSVNNKRVR